MKTNIITAKAITEGKFSPFAPNRNSDFDQAVLIKRLPMLDYLKSTAWGSGEIKKSCMNDGGNPEAVKFAKDHPELHDVPRTDAQRLGSIYHSYLLENDTFEKYHTIVSDDIQAECLDAARVRAASKAPKKFSKALGAYKRWLERGNLPEMLTPDIEAKLLEAAVEEKLPQEFSTLLGTFQDWKKGMMVSGKEVVTMAELDTFEQMRESVMNDERCAEILSLKGLAEATIFAPVEGSEFIVRKVRPDWLPLEGDCQIDLKTTKDAHPDAFGRDAWNFRYHVQAAYHLMAARECGFPMERFGWIAQEKVAPFSVSLQWCAPHHLDWGLKYIAAQLESIESYFAKNHWPKLPTDMEAEMPAYAETQMERPIYPHLAVSNDS